MKKNYYRSFALSLILVFIITTLALLEFAIVTIITTALILGSLLVGVTKRQMKKAKSNIDVFGDNIDYKKEVVIKVKKSKNKKKKVPVTNNLNQKDMELFSKVTDDLRLHILNIKECMSKSSVINQIMNDTGGEKALDIMFASILNEPERLTDVDNFAYTNVPYLSKLIMLHVETEAQVFKNKRTNQLLEQSKETIETLAKDIVADYFQYKDKDLDRLETQIQHTASLIIKNKRRREG